jgi:hypothetical protein
LPDGEKDYRIKIMMPGTTVENEAKGEQTEEDLSSVYFVVELSNPTNGIKLSKKRSCTVEVRP